MSKLINIIKTNNIKTNAKLNESFKIKDSKNFIKALITENLVTDKEYFKGLEIKSIIMKAEKPSWLPSYGSRFCGKLDTNKGDLYLSRDLGEYHLIDSNSNEVAKFYVYNIDDIGTRIWNKFISDNNVDGYQDMAINDKQWDISIFGNGELADEFIDRGYTSDYYGVTDKSRENGLAWFKRSFGSEVLKELEDHERDIKDAFLTKNKHERHSKLHDIYMSSPIFINNKIGPTDLVSWGITKNII